MLSIREGQKKMTKTTSPQLDQTPTLSCRIWPDEDRSSTRLRAVALVPADLRLEWFYTLNANDY